MTEQRDGSAGRILVVDDNEMNRDLLVRRLQRRGYEVGTAENGRQALEVMGEADYDVVLLDVMMPEMNGYEVLEHLKAHATWQHVPVIMISALDEMDSIVRCVKLGAADYLPKPFNATLLGARVEACLARKRLHDREQLYAASLERELDIAQQIQLGFLPAELPRIPGWELAASFIPARQVGGDFYDAFVLPRSGGLVHVVADVCDKGVGAALFMALFRSLMRAFAERSARDADPGSAEHLLEVIASTNDYIARIHDRDNMFATVFLGALNADSGVLRYVNAGHDPPVILRAGGAVERLAPTGPAVGLLPESNFEIGEIELRPGDLILAFTDGITDARSETGESFGEENLVELVVGAGGSAAQMLATIERELATFTAGALPVDDCTALALRRQIDG